MRELERQHNDKLNIIRSMTANGQVLIPINLASTQVNSQ